MNYAKAASAYFDRDASPDEILAIHKNLVENWSSGEVTKPDLLGRRDRPERGGLLCQRIFGPVDNWRCACGAVEGRDNDGTTCERCGVLCTSSHVRNERLGHFATISLLHPALVDLVAAVLELTSKEVLALVNLEAYLGDDKQVVSWPLIDPPI